MANKQKYGKWEVKEEIYRHIFLVKRDDQLGALKIDRNPERNTIKKEAKILSQLDHPNIVKLLDYDLEAETPYLVTEYHSHHSLSFTDLNDWKTSDRRKFFYQYCDAVAYCHSKGIAKYDHKLGNIVLDEDGTPIVIDFGSSSKHLNESSISNDIKGLGRFFWEIMEGKRLVEFSSNPNIRSAYPNHKERYLQRKIQKLQEDIDELKQQKAELLS
jgi:serine/threonine protein kinase